MATGCLSRENLLAFLESNPNDSQHVASSQHFRTCDRCQADAERIISGLMDSVVSSHPSFKQTSADSADAAQFLEHLQTVAPGLDSNALSDRATCTNEAKFATVADVDSNQDHECSSIGAYHLVRRIGHGGFGIVYQAEQYRPLRRTVALKVIKPGMDSQEIIARFAAERQSLALMDHPNIARVLDAGETEAGRPYFVMELVNGTPITDYSDQHRLSIRERLQLFLTVCEAVQHSHRRGIIHRDLKPSNVLITERESKATVKVIDFGIAKALTPTNAFHVHNTTDGQIIGTPPYMSPEQMEAVDVDARTDVYSLGIILYELLVGSLPFGSMELRPLSPLQMIVALRDSDLPRPSIQIKASGREAVELAKKRDCTTTEWIRQVRGDLEWIALKAIEKDRNRRYDGLGALLSDLGRFLADEPVRAAPPRLVDRFRKMLKRNRLTLGTIAAVCVALIVGANVALWLAYVDVVDYFPPNAPLPVQGKEQLIARSEAVTAPARDHNGRTGNSDANQVVQNDIVRTLPLSHLAFVGDESLVNTITAGNQQTYSEATSTAMNASGNYVIVWTESEASGVGSGIYAQRFNASGKRQGGEFQINVKATGRQERPTVAMDRMGNFVVAWASQGEDGSDFGIYARRYHASGAPVGIPFRVNTYTALTQHYPNVTMSSTGDFLITWTSFSQAAIGDDVYGQRFSAKGMAIGDEFRINSIFVGDQYFSKAAYDAAGNFIVTWTGGSNSSGHDIFARRFSVDGVPLDATDFLVSTDGLTGTQSYSAVAMGAAGDAVITWSGPDSSRNGIYAKRFSTLSDTVGTALPVNATALGDQQWPNIAMAANGQFAITWTGFDNDGGEDIFAQAYAPDGAPNGANFVVNSHTPGNQRFANIAMAADGRFVINWSSDGQDGSGFGVYAQRYFTDRRFRSRGPGNDLE
jgi:serine/threonine protein kinase